MKHIDFSIRRLNLNNMIRSRKFQDYISDRIGNDLCLEDPERYERIQEYAENGSDGSTHSETIEDWTCFLESLRRIPSKVRERIEAEIMAVYEWHVANGSINKIIG